MSARSTLLVAHPKELIRAGIGQLLDDTAVSIVGEAADATTALALARKLRPDVMLVDVGIPGGDCFELAYTVRQASPATKVVTISAIDNPTYMARAKAAGVVDHLAKGIGARALAAAIVAAAAGKPGSGSRGFARIVSLLNATEKSCRAAPSLSPREDQILRHIALGLSNEEIARSLGIGIETVKEHVQKMLRKLQLPDRTAAAVWVLKTGLVTDAEEAGPAAGRKKGVRGAGAAGR